MRRVDGETIRVLRDSEVDATVERLTIPRESERPTE
jgi:hypothetical protein